MRADGKETLRKIDSCFQVSEKSLGKIRMKEYSIKELVVETGYSDKTVRKCVDIIKNGGKDKYGSEYWPADIRENYDEILNISVGRSNVHSFSYIDPRITLFPDTITKSIVKDLIPFVDYINSVEGLDNFSNVADVIMEMIEEQGFGHLLNKDNRKIVRLDSKSIFNIENNEPVRDFLPICRNAILNNVCLSIVYKPFGVESFVNYISPLKIIEYNNRWTLIAILNKSNSDLHSERNRLVNNYPLDRILDVALCADIPIIKFNGDIDKVLDLSYGPSISDWINIPYIKLVLKVSNRFINFIKTKPIITKAPIEEMKEHFTILTYKKIVDTIELKQFIRSYADQIEVLEPQDFRDSVIEDLKKTLGNYS